jgi:uncharacterized protein involved in exopolysaccharide biosynthesis
LKAPMREKNEELQKSFFDTLTDFIIKIKPQIVLLWSNRKQLVWMNGGIGVISILILYFIIKPYYQSTVIILPDFGNKSSDMFGQLSGLAAMAGVNVGGDGSTQIYQNLIMSESVMNEVIYRKYETKEYDKPVDLIEYFEIKPDNSLPDTLQKRKMFLKMFEILTKGNISISYELKSKILTVVVEMPESKLSADVANTLVGSLDKYVRTQRKSFATEQRKYLVSRVQQIKDTLSLCEEDLKTFREKNRQIAQSPELLLEQTRLMRNAEIQQTIFVELTKQLELVKLAEVKDVPVVNVREYAKDPIIKTGPKRIMTLSLILFFSFLCSAGWVLGREKVYDAIEGIKKG